MGTQPHFSGRSFSCLGLALILANLTIIPLAQTSPRSVQASNPTVSATIANYGFHPQHIKVTTGTQVIWSNDDGTYHTVTSENITQGGAHLVDSGSLNSGQSFSFTFYKHGFYPYACFFHTYMTGWVNVTGSDVQPPSPPMTTTSTDYTRYAIAAAVAVAIVIVSVAIFLRRRSKNPGKAQPLILL